MEKSRDTPLNVATTETSPVRRYGHSSYSSSSRPENHVIPGDMDLTFESQPDYEDGEEEDAPPEADVGQDGELSAEEIIFLEMFPGWKKQQEKLIATLHAFAKDADKISRKFTEKNVLNKSVTVVAELVSIVGLALASASGGIGLPLAVFGQSVSVLAAFHSILTKLRENSRNEKLLGRANSKVPNPDEEFEDPGGKKTAYITAAGQAMYKCGRAWDVISKHTHTLFPSKALSHVAQRSLTTSVLPIEKAVGIYGGPSAFMSLAGDVYSLWDNWKKLKNKEKAELAEDLRARAEELEEELTRRTKRYNTLKKKKELREKRLRRSSLKEAKKTQTQPPSRSGKAGSWGSRKMNTNTSEMN
ncbi:apolipoprotein L6-like [Heterocephalus glaber]|uniref:Apolipoprotein L6-like n=1 Tax=Heterocephalus glaber TaxID=10181 RepID=A0AAX6P7W6_HETGA|nr:apolipoprotein L6-like [Heterocephalus glaber]